MIVFVDENNCIRDVGKTDKPNLTELFIADETNPFVGWSTAKICCYKVTVDKGIVTMYTPYIDSRNLEMIDNMGHQIDATSNNAEVTAETIDEVMTDVIPELAGADANLTATLDSILTDIIPSLMGE